MSTQLNRIATNGDLSLQVAAPDEVSLHLLRAKAIVELIAEAGEDLPPGAVSGAADEAARLIRDALQWHSVATDGLVA